MRARNKYNLDLADAVKCIQAVNVSATMCASDRAIRRLFSVTSDLLNADCVSERVAVLDGLWGTRLYMESGSADQIAACIGKSGKNIAALISGLVPDALENSPEDVYGVAKKILPHILNHTEKCRENYSFATKFFHWCTRFHFPIVDSRARLAINALQTQLKVRPRIRKSTVAMGDLTYIEEYQRWIHFYSDLIAGLTIDQRKMLVDADRDSQNSVDKMDNSLLRILDKVFYFKGGGRGMGRMEG